MYVAKETKNYLDHMRNLKFLLKLIEIEIKISNYKILNIIFFFIINILSIAL